MEATPTARTESPLPGGLPYQRRHPAYGSWTAGADAALLRRFRAGRTRVQPTKEFVRTADEVETRLFELLERTPGRDAVFAADGAPLRDSSAAVQPPEPTEPKGELPPLTEPPPDQDDDYDEPDRYGGLGGYDEPLDPLEGDPELAAIMEGLADFEDERAELEEEQDSIRATFEYLMERDDI